MYQGKNGSYKIIGVCASGIHTDHVQEIVWSVFRSASARGFKVLLFNTFSDFFYDNEFVHGEESVFELINYGLLDALVILPESIKNPEVVGRIVRQAQKEQVFVVSLDSRIELCSSIYFQAVDAFEQIVRHVVEYHKRRRINVIAGFQGNEFSEERVNCVRRVMEENHLTLDEERIGYGDFWEGPTERVVEQFLASSLPFPDAIICCNDTMAITACQALRRHGIQVPEDVIVTGFDGIDLERYCSPRLTTAAANIDTLGQKALELIEDALAGENRRRDVAVPYELRISQSCGCEEMDYESAGEKVFELYQKLNLFSSHESAMLNYLAKLIECSELTDMAQIAAGYCDRYTWCCVNSDFLAYEGEKQRYHDCFTEQMKVMLRRRDEQVDSGMLFPACELLPELEEELERHNYLMFSPMHYQREVIGYLAVAIDREGFLFQNTRRFLSNTNRVLENFRNRKNLEQVNAELDNLYQHDPLTGIYNRRGFYFHAAIMMRRAAEEEKKIVLYSIDMDGLKRINDTYGHKKGDQALNAIVKAIGTSLNDGDICARFGGDEFVVLSVAEDDEAAICTYFKRLAVILEEINRTGEHPCPLQVSMGAAAGECGSPQELDEMIRVADERMYQQKKEHKGRRADEIGLSAAKEEQP